MTRIVAGAAGGRRLKVPAAVTRPTSDRVREALFSSLVAARELAGARVLDLYAGSGALGLESASRGATAVTLVDDSLAAVSVMRQNMSTVGLPGIRVVKAKVRDFLTTPARPHDIVFLDPPYAVPAAEVGERTDRAVGTAGYRDRKRCAERDRNLTLHPIPPILRKGHKVL